MSTEDRVIVLPGRHTILFHEGRMAHGDRLYVLLWHGCAQTDGGGLSARTSGQGGEDVRHHDGGPAGHECLVAEAGLSDGGDGEYRVVHVPHEIAKRVAACEYAAVILRDRLCRIAETADKSACPAALTSQGLPPQGSGGVHAAAIP